MKLPRLPAAIAAVAAAAAILTGCAAASHHASPAASRPHAAAPAHPAPAHPALKASTAATRTPATSPALAWLASPGGQAEADFGNAIDTLAQDLEIESHDDSVANHLAFEADARAVRAQARHILATPGLLPHTNAPPTSTCSPSHPRRNLLQPGSGYGTTPQDYTAWYQALGPPPTSPSGNTAADRQPREPPPAGPGSWPGSVDQEPAEPAETRHCERHGHQRSWVTAPMRTSSSGSPG